ncbi:molybdopterin molybdotransferase MoeA [Paraburkholderia bonniea]|uniref:molybdopterin molybdotransferase MoeA n=1 Tax=Paraburkholderia bonniea TaxID=2152891 RepID=UPI001290EC27|nr:gephyrin-like molybdotransferase Glp [Paraburkholderia bonniea]WJF89507.1 molybdopterin molybdotransferase MoeA [Paraburkholderia bonniea]WJF92822.1 molybdopterin molybdotransferase MoeA [Paraburkholderia bonniea]
MTTPNDLPRCVTQHDPHALSVNAAQALVREWAMQPAALETESVALHDAPGRVLAHDLISPLNLPVHDNSAMDGFAFASAALLTPATATATATLLELGIAGKALAGHPFRAAVPANQCVRITTGAWLPEHCDTVIPHERVEEANHTIRFAADAVRRGANCRRAGEDLAAGQVALRAGRIIQAADVGLLASLGLVEVTVRRRLRVAFFSTGDELRQPGEPLDPGCVYDSNRPMLLAMLRRLNCTALDLGIVRDEPATLEAALRNAASQADIVLSSGGVSAGEADFTQRLLQTLGDMAFWGVAIRPGRPLTFGRIWPGEPSGNAQAALFFGLPGNPAAMMVTFYLFVREALLARAGAQPQPLNRLRAQSREPLHKRAGRTEYLRGVARCDSDGQWQVTPTRSQSSGALGSLTEANCFIVLAPEQTSIQPDEAVEILLFDGLV